MMSHAAPREIEEWRCAGDMRTWRAALRASIRDWQTSASTCDDTSTAPAVSASGSSTAQKRRRAGAQCAEYIRRACSAMRIRLARKRGNVSLLRRCYGYGVLLRRERVWRYDAAVIRMVAAQQAGKDREISANGASATVGTACSFISRHACGVGARACYVMILLRSSEACAVLYFCVRVVAIEMSHFELRYCRHAAPLIEVSLIFSSLSGHALAAFDMPAARSAILHARAPMLFTRHAAIFAVRIDVAARYAILSAFTPCSFRASSGIMPLLACCHH